VGLGNESAKADEAALGLFSDSLGNLEPECVKTGQDWWVIEKKVFELMEAGHEIPQTWADHFSALNYWPKGFVSWVEKKWFEEVFEKEWSQGKLRSTLIQERMASINGLSSSEKMWVDPWQESYEIGLEKPEKIEN